MTKRVLLTGASGFIGSHVARELSAVDAEVLCLVRTSSDLQDIADFVPQTNLLSADLEDSSAIRDVVLTAQPEVVCHLAWSGVSRNHRNSADQVRNIASTLNLLMCAAESGCEHFVGVGSQAEYGSLDGLVEETSCLSPSSLYGAAKVGASMFAHAACATMGIRFAWLRLFSAYGPGDAGDWLLPSTIKALFAGECPPLTKGEQLWDYLYVADAACAIRKVSLSETAMGFMNLGSGTPVAVRDVVKAARDLIDPALPLGFGEVPYASDQTMHMEADITRLLTAIDWHPQTALSTGLRATIDWHRELHGR